MDKWNEIRTAYKLAKLGTLSATAEDIGVHRSTVMRHIDLLEENLGIKLFQRNDKGYIPTEAGLDIMRLGEVTDNHFSQLSRQIKSKEHILEGKLTITCVSDITPLVMPSISKYQVFYPRLDVDIIDDLRNFNLEYGEADIAIRAGEKPTTPDNITWPLTQLQLVPCADISYIDRCGLPTLHNLHQHRFIALKGRPKHLGWNEWIYNTVAKENIVLTSSSQQVLTNALLAGCGIGFLPKEIVNESAQLTELSFNMEWFLSVWILVHRDMLNTPKIAKFLDIILKRESEA